MTYDFFGGLLLGALLGLGAGVLLAKGTTKCEGCDWCDRARRSGAV